MSTARGRRRSLWRPENCRPIRRRFSAPSDPKLRTRQGPANPPPSGWSLVAGRSKPASLTVAGTSDPFPPSTCEGIVMVSDQLAPRGTRYAAATSAAAAIAALQFISLACISDRAAGPGQDSVDSFSVYWKAKWPSVSWLVRLFRLPRAYLHGSFADARYYNLFVVLA